jgi:hypothetical protein
LPIFYSGFSEKSRLFPKICENFTKLKFFLQIRIENDQISRKTNFQTIWKKIEKLKKKPKNPIFGKKPIFQLRKFFSSNFSQFFLLSDSKKSFLAFLSFFGFSSFFLAVF